MLNYKNTYKPLYFSLIGMGVIVIIFYPLFTKLEGWITNISVKLVKSGNSLAGRYLGLLLAFVAGMVILLYFYTKMWYNINIFKILIQGNIGTIY